MVDDLTPQPVDPEVAGDLAPAKPQNKIKAFLATTVGKIVLIGCALTMLGAIIAVIATVVLGFLGARMVQDGVDKAIQGAPGAGTGSVATTKTVKAVEATKVPAPVANSEIYTFRDIFEVLAAATVPAASENTTDGTTFNGEADTLYLLDVVTEDGVRHAVLWWNGTTHTLAAGEGIANTPWMVVEVGTDSAIMLYGDSTVSLRVGQGSVAAK